MSYLRRSLPALSLVCLLLVVHAAHADEAATPASLWEDFIHYVRIHNVQLAQGSGEALLKATDDQKLLDVVEKGSLSKEDTDQLLVQAGRVEQLKAVSEKLLTTLQEARIKRAREKARIQEDIENLAKGARANRNAIERLRAAGQFAAPQLLQTLLDDNHANLHPDVLSAMTAIGQPMVNPLSTALANLEPRPAVQVANVLADIGYIGAMPYLKEASGLTRFDADTRAKVQAAYSRLLRQAPNGQDLPAAEQFLLLGRAVYLHKTETLAGYDAFTKRGMLWVFSKQAGLIWQDVPGPIYGDALAMNLAQRALTLDPNLDQALSLWLVANVRREIQLPKGQPDPSYPATMKPAAFYLRMAGPQRQHDVLDRALRDNDTAVALQAIDALAATVGTDTVVNHPDLIQPLVQAMYYPDRRVRYAAAFAMTNVRPEKEFPGCFRVVPVLGEAVRQTATRYALLIASDEAQRNKIAGELSGKDLGYQVISAATLKDAADLINISPGLDVVMAAGGSSAVQVVLDGVAKDGRLAGVPMVVVAAPAVQSELTPLYADAVRKPVFVGAGDAATLKPVLADAAKAYAGAAISDKEATDYALTALKILEQMATSSGKVYRIGDAQAALIQALGDTRPEVIRQAGVVLALMNSAAAQKALAEAGLDANRPEDIRVLLLGSLADSAIRFGNQLDAGQVDRASALVKQATGKLAITASRLYGTLSLPTVDVVKMIIPAGK